MKLTELSLRKVFMYHQQPPRVERFTDPLDDLAIFFRSMVVRDREVKHQIKSRAPVVVQQIARSHANPL